jgi:hypothetical protein
MKCDNYSRAETIQGRKLFKGGNYYLLGVFDRRNYSREENIQGQKVFKGRNYSWKYGINNI